MKLQRWCCLLTFLIYSGMSVAGGFQLWEQDASGIGDYHAGAAAEANGAGTEYYNPAGMIHLQHFETSFGLTYIPLYVNFDGIINSTSLRPTRVFGDSYSDNFVPNFHLVYPLNPRVALGFGVTTPFGLQTNYPSDIFLAGAGTNTQLKTVNLNPSVAFSLSKYISVGAGFDVLYGSASYDNMITLYRPYYSSLKNTLSDWGYGWNAGILFFLNPQVRAGVSYRSEITLDGNGTSTYESYTPYHFIDTLIVNKHLKGQINLPSTTIFGLYADVTPHLSLLFSAFYTQWDIFQNLILDNVIVMETPLTIRVDENYKNSWNLAVGAHIALLDNLMLKIGFGHDQTPTQYGYRDIRLPDADRYAAAVGLHWQARPSIGLDTGWIHFFPEVAYVDNALGVAHSPLLGYSTRGTAIAEVDVFGFQLTWKPGAKT